MKATFTPLFTPAQQDEYNFYSRKISALTRSRNMLEGCNRTEKQDVRYYEVLKDIKVFKCKRTKLVNACVLF